MAASPAGEDASDEWPPRTCRLVSAACQNKAYPEGLLRVNETGNEIELREWTGKNRGTEAVVARFNLEPNVEVLMDGPILKVSELSITLESPAVAGEVADLLRRPPREREEVRLVSEAESSVRQFLEVRKEALNLLSRIRVDPRGTLLDVQSIWTTEDAEPLDAVYSNYSTLLAESLEKMTSSLAAGEKTMGSGVTNRLYAIAYTLARFRMPSSRGVPTSPRELAALRELGIATTVQDLRIAKPAERLMLEAAPERRSGRGPPS